MISYDFGTFVMFSIFESVILIFLKHSNFRGFLKQFTKKIMQIDKSRTSEDLGRLRKTKNEDSRVLRRLTRGRNYVPKFRGKIFEDEDLKRRKIGETGHGKVCHVPSTFTMRLGHGFCKPCT
jgi:hypothetical protein